jgi:hypothetical protein
MDNAETSTTEAAPETSTEAPSRESTEIKSSDTGSKLNLSLKRDKPAESTKSEGLNIRKSLRANMKEPAEKVEAQVSAAPPAQSSGQQVTQASAQAAAAILPPADMSAEEKEVFNNLLSHPTPENVQKLQAYISRRAYEQRSDYTRKTMELAEREKAVSDVMGVMKEYAPAYAKEGIGVQDIVRRAVAWDQSFKADRLGAAREFLESYGIDPSELVGGEAEQAPNYLTREEAEALAEEKAQSLLMRRDQESLAQQNYSALQSFVESKPLFRDPGTAAQLEEKMAPIVAALKDSNPYKPVREILDYAYDLVTKGDPTFSGLVSQLNAKSDAERQQAEADKAKALSRSISGGPGSGSPKVKSKNFREGLARRMGI